MARKGENIYKRKDGRWEARFIVGRKQNGKAIYKSIYARSYKEVKEKRRKAMEEMEKSDYPEQPKAGTVTAVCKSWLECNARTWKESTFARYREKVNGYIIPQFGDREFSEISTEELDRFIVMIQTEGMPGKAPVCANTAAMVLTVLKQIRLHALRSDCRVRFNPECIRIKRGGNRNITIFTEGEEKTLVLHLMKNLNETSAGVLTSLFTGIRIGELCALNCDNIDPENDVLHVVQTVQRLPSMGGENKTSLKIDTPKSLSSVRDIPICKELKDVLKQFHKPGALLLTGEKDVFVEPRTMENRFSAILKKCGLKKVKYHTTRHTFATRCIERGMDPKTLAEILGHSSVATTLDYYVHLSMALKAQGVELLSDLFAV